MNTRPLKSWRFTNAGATLVVSVDLVSVTSSTFKGERFDVVTTTSYNALVDRATAERRVPTIVAGLVAGGYDLTDVESYTNERQPTNDQD